MKTCTTIIGQYPNLQPILCGDVGIQVGEVVKCKEHWNQTRNARGENKKTRANRKFREYQEH